MRAEGPGSEAGEPSQDGSARSGAPAAGRAGRGGRQEPPRPASETSKQPVRSEYTGEMPVVTDTEEDPAKDIRGT
jgi:hypothetical protein